MKTELVTLMDDLAGYMNISSMNLLTSRVNILYTTNHSNQPESLTVIIEQ